MPETTTLLNTNTLTHFDVVGSFLRPTQLKQARNQFATGNIDHDALKAIENETIKDLVQKEINAGLTAVSDGEFRRSWWHLDFLWNLDGVKKYDGHESYRFHEQKTRTDNVKLSGKVHYNANHPFFDYFKKIQEFTEENVTVKQTIPSPTLLFRDGRTDNWRDFYNDRQELLKDIAKTYHKIILRFYDLGCRYLQLDDTTWAFLISKLNASKDDASQHNKYVKLCEEAVTVINNSIANLPDDLTLATHICRGNYKSTYLYSGGYDAVANYLKQLNYNVFFLEYDDEGSGSFAPLQTIWNNRPNVTIYLGIITSKRPELEDKDVVVKRIKEASQFVPLENLALSPQCGFASTEEGNKLTEEQQWAKLKLVKEISDTIWRK